jgi:hypothetical protein
MPRVAVQAGGAGRVGRSLKVMVLMLAKLEGDLVFDTQHCCCKEVTSPTLTSISPM